MLETRRKLFIFIALLIALSTECIGASNIIDSTVSANPVKILLADIKISPGMPGMDNRKVEAALNLAALLTKKYSLIPFMQRDSVVAALQKDSIQPSAIEVGKRLGAGRLYFLSVARLKNMLRVELISRDTTKAHREQRGVGYCLVHFVKEKDSAVVYDPSLLTAVQRALAVTECDSNIYSDAGGNFRVFPAKTLVIGGIIYSDDLSQPLWELYTHKEITSYDASETIFAEAKNSAKYAAYDLESRDTIFTLFNLYEVDNFKAPTVYEIEALYKLGVDDYITGTLKRSGDKAEIELMLCSVGRNTLNIKHSVTGVLEKDDIDTFRSVLTKLTRELLN